jgi:NifU-like protein involved in Fe-S cluster formation
MGEFFRPDFAQAFVARNLGFAVHKYPARVKCAILSWHAVMAALKGDAKPVTTESEQT